MKIQRFVTTVYRENQIANPKHNSTVTTFHFSFSLISSSILAAQAFAAENQSYGLAASQGTINMEEDEYEWSIDDDVEFDDPEFLIKYDLIDRDEISTLKSGQR